MSRSSAWLQLALSVLLFAAFGLMSYFGQPNPVVLGLQSSFGVALLAVAGITALRFLPACWALTLCAGFIAASWLVIVANWWHFQFFRGYFNLEFIVFARDGGEALQALGEFEHWPATLSLGAVCAISLLLFYFWHRTVVNRIVLLAQVLLCSLVGGALLLTVNAKLGALQQANALTLSPYYFHPLHAFLYSPSAHVEGAEESWRAFRQKNEVTKAGAYLPAGVAPEKYNIIVITMESFRASFVGAYSPGSRLTPNFDRISKEGVLFRDYYANSNFTVKSENAILCGFFDHNAKPSIAEHELDKGISCLPSILAHQGYSSWYFHGNKGKFYSRRSYLPKLGFENLYFHADEVPAKDDGRDYIGWGLADTDLFSLALDKLGEKPGEPFFAQLMSLSNHYPFKFDWPVDVPNDLSLVSGNKIYAAYENAVFYSDYALGKFWDTFRQSDLYRNTIVVVTGDHGVWSFDDSKIYTEAQRNEELFRVPLFIYHPKIERAKVVDQVSSHVDVPVTLLSLVGAETAEASLIGKNLFDRVKEPWAIMMKGGEVSVRVGNALCLPKKPVCAGAYQSCWADTGVADFIENLGDGSCFQYNGDPLAGGYLEHTDELPGLMMDSLGVIAFDNRRILESENSALNQLLRGAAAPRGEQARRSNNQVDID